MQLTVCLLSTLNSHKDIIFNKSQFSKSRTSIKSINRIFCQKLKFQRKTSITLRLPDIYGQHQSSECHLISVILYKVVDNLYKGCSVSKYEQMTFSGYVKKYQRIQKIHYFLYAWQCTL